MSGGRCRWQEQWIEVGGNLLFLRRAGSGPPVLFLHGYPETSLTWRHAFDALQDRFTCLAPDLAGWGRSEGRGSLSLLHLLDDTVELIRKLELEKPIVVGHDWGAAIAYGLGALHPHRVRRIVTVNFSPGRFQLSRPLHFYFFALPLLPDLLLRLWPEEAVDLIMRWWAAKLEELPPEVMRSYRRAARAPWAQRATLSYYRHMVWRALLGKPPLRMGPWAKGRLQPQVPWDVLWGMKDPVASPKVLSYLQQEFPTLRVARIADAGHFPQEESPEDFLAALQHFLASEEPAAANPPEWLTPKAADPGLGHSGELPGSPG